jgi:hypothetical protein
MSDEEEINTEDYSDFEKSLKEKEASNEDRGESMFDAKIKQIQDGTNTASHSVEDLLDDNKPLEDGSVNSGNETQDKPKEKIEVPKDKTFEENPGSVDQIMREVMVGSDDVEITDTDKRDYIKAVLNDMPVKLDISLCAGQVTTKIRSRTSWEQTCMYAALQKDQDEAIVKDLASVVIQLQKYGACLMIESLNDKSFSKEKIAEDEAIPEAVEKLRKLRQEKIEHLSSPKWNLLLNALRVFEAKLSKMGTQCLNENFWEPVG